MLHWNDRLGQRNADSLYGNPDVGWRNLCMVREVQMWSQEMRIEGKEIDCSIGEI
jgi:hypothetical protein